MAFGRSGESKQAETSNQGVSTTAINNAAQSQGAGTNLLNKGGEQVQSGANFFNTIANGNRDATSALLAPDISRIRDANAQSLQASSTLMPRGGGRSATLFGRPMATNDAVNGLFTQARSGAAANLASIGQAQQGLGANLYGIANGGLGTAGNVNSANLNYEQQRQANINNGIQGYIKAGSGALFG